MTYLNLGMLEREDGQVDEATRSVARTMEIAGKLQARFADDLQLQFVLAKATYTNGQLYWEKQQRDCAWRASNNLRSRIKRCWNGRGRTPSFIPNWPVRCMTWR